MAIGFLKRHIAGTTENIVMPITITDASYDPTGAIPIFSIGLKGAAVAQYTLTGTLAFSAGVWTATWTIPEGATSGLVGGEHRYQTFLDKDGDLRATDAGPILVEARFT